MREDIEDILERRMIHYFRAEAMKEKSIADDLLYKALNDSDDISIELIWDVVDRYRHAIRLSRGVDLELEAHIASDIGEIFYSKFKYEDRSVHFFEHGIALANALVPRVLPSVGWLKNATQRLMEIQEKIKRKAESSEEDEYKQLKKKYANELKTDFESIAKEGDKPSAEFLAFIYAKYPSKATNAQWKKDDPIKKQLQTALVHYHPDKNMIHEEKWIILVTEITIILNLKYSEYSC